MTESMPPVLKGEVEVPGVGSVPKGALFGIVGLGVAYVGWRWWQARSSNTAGDTQGATGDFGDTGVTPDVLGAVSSNGTITNAGGSNTTSNQPTPGAFTTNAAWSQDVTNQLVQSDKWSYTDIVTALGNYLNGKPLNTIQQSIVQAAIAIDGHPPVGSFSLVPGGDTPITIAPTGLKVTTTADSATVTFSPVSGAAYYRVYRSGVSGNVGATNGTSVVVGGLAPNTSYTFYIAAVSASGALSPRSPGVIGKTLAVTLTQPNKPTVTAIQTTSAHVATGAVKGATGYNWFINGAPHGHTDAPAYTFSGLHSRTSYSVAVAADNNTQAPGPKSAATTFKTK